MTSVRLVRYADKAGSAVIGSLVAAVCMGLVLIAGPAAADDQRGVLPDGRAFRTDAEGNEIVDYIAELEVSVETLTSRVHSLEDELKAKDRRLSAVEQGRGDTQLVETDLIGGAEREGKGKVLAAGKLVGAPAQCPPAPHCPAAVVCPPVPTPIRCPAAPDCREDIERCEDRLAKAKDELEEQGDKQEEMLAALKDQLEDAQDELEKRKESLADSGTEVGRLKEELESLTKSRDALKIQTAGLQRQLEEAQSHNLQARERTEQARNAIGRGVVYEPSSGNAVVQDELGRARQMAITSVKGRLRTAFNELNGMIAKRDRLFKEYAQTNRSVAVKPRAVVASSGTSMQQVRISIEKVNTMRELAELQRDIASMRTIVQEDLALIDRVR